MKISVDFLVKECIMLILSGDIIMIAAIELKQPIIKDTTVNIGGYIHGSQFVKCPKCKQEVSLTSSYYDPYYSYKHTAQVHYSCLSKKRIAEIQKDK